MSLKCQCSISSNVSEERSRDSRKASQLTDKIRSIGSLDIKDRVYHLKTYYSCFVGSDLVDCLISCGEAETREEGIGLGQLLLDTDYIHHVVDDHNFKDGYFFFRFRQDEIPKVAMQGPSVAYLKGEEGVLISLLAHRRTMLGWMYSLYVLSPNNKTIYQFKSELDSSPSLCYSIQNCSVQPGVTKNGKRHTMQFFMNSPTGREKGICLAADNSSTQFTWISCLSSAGVEILTSADEEEASIQSAMSIFEFEAYDIDRKRIDMNLYRGHVTLIVNVASQCGLADKNYTQLVYLHNTYAGSKGLRILAFPCNQFGNQEPGTAEDIKAFGFRYNVQFDVFSKIEVNGENAHPLYKFLKSRLKGNMGNFIKWNYAKFLCDADGIPYKRYSPTTQPMDIIPDLEKLWSATPQSP